MIFPGLIGNGDCLKSLVVHLTEEKGFIVGIFLNIGMVEYSSPRFPDLSSDEEIEKALKFM
jgi:hypothetical protein